MSVAREQTSAAMERGETSIPDTLSTLFAAALDAIVVMDEAGFARAFNPAAERIFGFRREDIVGHPVAASIVPPAHRAAHEAGLQRLTATRQSQIIGQRIEIEAMRRDG